MANSATTKKQSVDATDLFGNQAVESSSPENTSATARSASEDSAGIALEDARQRIEHLEAELSLLKRSRTASPNPQSGPEGASHSRPSSPESEAPVLQSVPASEDFDDENTVDKGAANNSAGLTELRQDSMMAHLLDSLDAGKDIGHYGRLVFAMVARHFLPPEEVVAWLTKDRDFSQSAAEAMMTQVQGRNYNPPRRERILEWQNEQDFPILPDPHDPDCGNLYRTLKFPDQVYEHIQHYQEEKS